MWGLISNIIGLIDRFVPDQALNAQVKQEILNAYSSQVQSQAQVVTAEAQGDSWLQRNWRPLIMLMFGFIIFNNYILGAYFPSIVHPIPLPPDMWNLLEIGMGGYVIGRSVEKVVKNWKT